MSDEVVLNGKTYVSSKRAAEHTGYARDYIGQLSRSGSIDAERVGGLWYVSMESLQSYEKNAETARSITPISAAKEAESSLSFEGKEYISASRASKMTGYNQDYVGQLARAGKIPSRQIGNRWYVDREALIAHKAEKDALLAAVQSEAVGLKAAVAQAKPVQAPIERPHMAPQMTYKQESADLLPYIPAKGADTAYPLRNVHEMPSMQSDTMPKQQLQKPSPIAVVAPRALHAPQSTSKRSRRRLNRSLVGALTIILVLSVGFAGMRSTGTLAKIQESQSVASMSAGAAEAVGSIGDIIENWVSPLLVYERGK